MNSMEYIIFFCPLTLETVYSAMSMRHGAGRVSNSISCICWSRELDHSSPKPSAPWLEPKIVSLEWRVDFT